jgi:hypothetical protein
MAVSWMEKGVSVGLSVGLTNVSNWSMTEAGRRIPCRHTPSAPGRVCRAGARGLRTITTTRQPRSTTAPPWAPTKTRAPRATTTTTPAARAVTRHSTSPTTAPTCARRRRRAFEARDHVEMAVEDHLASLLARVLQDVARGRTRRALHEACEAWKLGEEGGRNLGRHVEHRHALGLGQQQSVARRERERVQDGERVIGLKNLVARDVALEDLVEQVVVVVGQHESGDDV